MNRKELIESLSEAHNISKASAEKTVLAVMDGIKKGLKKDKKVQISGFGTFSIRTRKARKGRNPQTGDEIKIKASRSVGFKAGKNLKAII
jgi:DNA-binding protein HU-beta